MSKTAVKRIPAKLSSLLQKNKNINGNGVPVSNPFLMKRSQRGLYAGEMIQFGDVVSSFGNRSKRTWKPHVMKVDLWSETLSDRVNVKVSATALALIDREGGLDSYILGQRVPESRWALEFKNRIIKHKLEN